MDRYYAAHNDFAVVFSNREDRDTFCKGNAFQPIGFYEFATRDLLGGWYMVRDFTKKEMMADFKQPPEA